MATNTKVEKILEILSNIVENCLEMEHYFSLFYRNMIESLTQKCFSRRRNMRVKAKICGVLGTLAQKCNQSRDYILDSSFCLECYNELVQSRPSDFVEEFCITCYYLLYSLSFFKLNCANRQRQLGNLLSLYLNPLEVEFLEPARLFVQTVANLIK